MFGEVEHNPVHQAGAQQTAIEHGAGLHQQAAEAALRQSLQQGEEVQMPVLSLLCWDSQDFGAPAAQCRLLGGRSALVAAQQQISGRGADQPRI